MSIQKPRIYEAGDTVKISAALPDVDPRKLRITVEGREVTIEGSLTQEKEVDRSKYSASVRRRGEFGFEIRLPREVSDRHVYASASATKLEITFRRLKAGEEAPKKFFVRL